ncbi:MAG TPA: Spy/CpxP family protein refolding chaperone [Deltaproteobacteria bacterium]|nr:Spy/CpxP family protein refolding chaperone [Deltaproteobacteria bacterium]HOM29829.1 Spy/CpxP family protein refolding chaperone [Deltaproteobacteria bacterium]HPP80611.1 Spy/CpxP family protein refolding chaperone [Deltaproteobacteria bacterium]
MKRTMIIVLTLSILTALAVPLMAWGPRWGYGPDGRGMMYDRDDRGDRGGFCRGGMYFAPGAGDLTPEQRERVDKLEAELYKKLEPLAQQERIKVLELEAAINADKPDEAKVLDLHKQIASIRDQIERARIRHQLEVKKVVPEARFRPVYMRGFMGGMGFGRGCGRI